MSVQQIVAVLRAGGWPVALIPTAVGVVYAESGGDPDATNSNRDGSTDTGLFQVNSVHGYSSRALRDPLVNARAALAVYRKQGWNAWVVYKEDKISRSDVAAGLAAVNAKPGEPVTWVQLPEDRPQLDDPIAGVVEDAAGEVAERVPGVAAAGQLVGALTSRDTWVRVLQVIGGLGAILAGGVLLRLNTFRKVAASVTP